MTNDLALRRRCRGLAFALGLTLAAGAAHAQMPPAAAAPPSGVAYPLPSGAAYPLTGAADVGPDAGADAGQAAPAPARGARRARADIQPYLEVAQVVSADLDGGDTLTYTSLAAGVDGSIRTRRVTVQMSYRYQRNIEWQGEVGDTDMHSGVAGVSVQVVPGTLQAEAGAFATRTGGQGRAVGLTDRDSSVEVYGAYAGPTLATHAGPVAVNAAYRVGYVAVDDDLGDDGPVRDDVDSAVTHSATASVGMAPGRTPVGWTVGVGYGRTDNDGEFDDRSEAMFARADVVVPVSPTLAVTAGVGYENIEASQNDVVRDAQDNPVIGPDGDVTVDPTRRELTYDVDGLIYDAGIIWRPSARTELQARAGHRYGGTTVVGSLAHRFSPSTGMTASVYDTVETFSSLLINDFSNLPDGFQIDRNPLTGGFGGCVFGSEPGRGVCLDRALQSIRGSTFRMRGASILFSGERGLWSWSAGAGYSHRRYGSTEDAVLAALGAGSDENFGVSASMARRLSRTSQLSLDAYASWFDTDEPDFAAVFGTGATLSYSRSLLLERMRLMAALGLYHTDDGAVDSTILSGLLGLRYSF